MNAFAPESDLKNKDRRGGKRSRTIKTGHLMYGEFSPTVLDCLIVEMSEEGARVQTSVMVQVPNSLTLILYDETERRCIRRWATGNQIGLEFLPKEE